MPQTIEERLEEIKNSVSLETAHPEQVWREVDKIKKDVAFLAEIILDILNGNN